MTRLAKCATDLHTSLEAETGVATGFRRVGSITAALRGERREEVFRAAAMARAFGLEVEELSPAEVAGRSPHLNTDGVTGGVWLPADGQGDPASIALALAKGGAEPLGREIGRLAGAAIRLHACERFCIVPEAIEGLRPMPVRRSPCHAHLVERGAVVGATARRERPDWSARPGRERAYRSSLGRRNWFDTAPGSTARVNWAGRSVSRPIGAATFSRRRSRRARLSASGSAGCT